MGLIAVVVVNLLCLLGYDYVKTKNPEKTLFQLISDKLKGAVDEKA